MNSVKRRGVGRPNRGGGKQVHGRGGGGGNPRGGGGHGGGQRGGGGGSGSKKGGAAAWDDGDTEFLVDVKVPSVSSDNSSENPEKYKVEMQKLHMTEQNQEIIKAALLDIRGSLDLRSAGSYRDHGRRLDHGYWMKDNQLLVRGVVDFSHTNVGTGQEEGATQVRIICQPNSMSGNLKFFYTKVTIRLGKYLIKVWFNIYVSTSLSHL